MASTIFLLCNCQRPECIDKAIDSPKGYILSTGCQIPKGTPIENVEIFMEAGRKYGRFK